VSQRLTTVLQLLRRFSGSGGAETPDAQLLARFVGHQDEAAFAELVRRHGPMVLGVCRRHLRDEHAAEDAFQVTFLTLACRARTLRRGQALPAWLQRVAYHIALRVRAKALRTAAVEREAMSLLRPEAAKEADWRELGPVLDDELRRMPEDLRGPLVLCGLEGKSHEDAARELGWPVGSLSKRLARGRELLRERLARRGFELGSAALTGTLIGEATAGVPEQLITTTVQGANQLGGLSATTAALLKEVLRAMFWTRVRSVVLLLLTVALIASAVGLGLLAAGWATSPQRPEANRPAQEDERPAQADPEKPRAGVVALGQKQFRMRAWIWGIAYSPDGKLLAITEASTVHLWDAVTRKEVRSWDGPKDTVVKLLAFSPDSKTLVIAGDNLLPHLWDVATGKLLREFPGGLGVAGASPAGIAFSPDGKLLAAVGMVDAKFHEDKGGKGRSPGPAVRLWETATGKELKGLADAWISASCVAFSPDGKFLVWGAWNGSVHVHKAPGWEEVFTSSNKVVPAPSILSLAVSPDSKVLAIGVGGGVKLFSLPGGQELRTIGEDPQGPAQVLVGTRLRFTPDGKTLAALSSSNHLTFWDVTTGKPSPRDIQPTGVSDLTFDPEGKTLATGGGQDQRVRFWDLVNDREEVEPGHRGPVTGVALSPHGTTVVTSSYINTDGLRFWDRPTGKQTRSLPKVPAVYFGYTADGLVIVGFEDNHLHLHDPATGKATLQIGKRMEPIHCLAVSPDGKLLAVGHEEIRVYDLATGKEKVKLPGHAWSCVTLAFGPDGKTLLSGGVDGYDATVTKLQHSLRLWDVTTGQEVRRLPHPPEWGIRRLAFSPDGKLAATTTHVWDMTTGRAVRELAQGAEWPLFSPDGKLLALPYQYTLPKSRGVIELWDTTTWEKVAVLEGHTGMIDALAFSADGKFLVSGSEDTSARVWELPERKKE
jgi:RNA polymerase sigma factor (sigma-70 family)